MDSHVREPDRGGPAVDDVQRVDDAGLRIAVQRVDPHLEAAVDRDRLDVERTEQTAQRLGESLVGDVDPERRVHQRPFRSTTTTSSYRLTGRPAPPSSWPGRTTYHPGVPRTSSNSSIPSRSRSAQRMRPH